MSLPEHFFISSIDGALHDTREPNWSCHSLRADYQRTFGHIRTVAQLKATLRNGPYAWPGGYPMYFVTSDGGALSFKTVREEFRSIADAIQSGDDNGWRVVGCDINYEDNDLYDTHTSERIESAYSD